MSDLLGPRVLASFPEPVEAAGLVSALADEGIVGRSVGDFTSGFQVEAPGTVDVLVSDGDFARASKVVERYERAETSVDWSTVDVGDDSPVAADESANASERRVAAGPWAWVLGVFLLLILVTLIF